MKIAVQPAVNLLHQTTQGVIATSSQSQAGYPFASALSFVADQNHHPIFLLSHLAEHSRNLQVDPRSSLLIQAAGQIEAEAGARMTLLGDTLPFDPDPLLVARYLRAHPSAERYLELEGFKFYRLTPSKLRLIAGFGQMGWVESAQWQSAQCLSLDREAVLLQQCKPTRGVIGIDLYGVDLLLAGQHSRIEFATPQSAETLEATLRQMAILS